MDPLRRQVVLRYGVAVGGDEEEVRPDLPRDPHHLVQLREGDLLPLLEARPGHQLRIAQPAHKYREERTVLIRHPPIEAGGGEEDPQHPPPLTGRHQRTEGPSLHPGEVVKAHHHLRDRGVDERPYAIEASRPVVREEWGKEVGTDRRHHMVAPDRLALSPGGKGHLIPAILHGTDADIGGTGDEAPAAGGLPLDPLDQAREPTDNVEDLLRRLLVPLRRLPLPHQLHRAADEAPILPIQVVELRQRQPSHQLVGVARIDPTDEGIHCVVHHTLPEAPLGEVPDALIGVGAPLHEGLEGDVQLIPPREERGGEAADRARRQRVEAVSLPDPARLRGRLRHLHLRLRGDVLKELRHLGRGDRTGIGPGLKGVPPLLTCLDLSPQSLLPLEEEEGDLVPVAPCRHRHTCKSPADDHHAGLLLILCCHTLSILWLRQR